MSGSRPSQTRSGTWPKRRARGRWTRTEMFFVEARYHRSPDRAAGQVRYIAHREEGLTDGRRRELYGIGERYRALRGAQGVFAVHHHGGAGRPAHPHVHALLSPRFENRMAVHISPARIQRVKERWEREVLAGLQRQERRLDRMRQGLVPRLPILPRDRDDRLPLQVLPFRPAPCRAGQLELFPRAKRAVRVAHEIGWARQWATVRLARHAMGAESREGGPPSPVPARVEGHAPGHSRRALAAARSPR